MRSPEFERMMMPVADTDPGYVRERQEKKRVAEQEDRYFGKEFFDAEGRYNGKPLDAIPDLFQELWKKRSTGSGLSVLTSFAEEMLYNPAVRDAPAVQSAVRGMPAAPFAPQELLRAILMREIPDDVMVEMLTFHRRFHEVGKKHVEALLPEMKHTFVKQLALLTHLPDHPLTSDILPHDTVVRRMEEVAVVTGDSVEYMREYGAVADYSHENNSITLLPEMSVAGMTQEEYLYETFAHEMFHVLAGRTIMRDKKEYRISRRGVLFHGALEWLDEAITEQLTLDLQGKKDVGGVYKQERNMYASLRKKVPHALFLRAYFENATPLNDPGRLRGQGELHQRIIDAYGFNILLYIEQLSRQGKMDEAAGRFDEKGNWKA